MRTVFLLTLLAMATPTLADTATKAATCYTVTDPDARAFCRAKAHSEPAACYSIQRQDMKAQCLAETRK